MKTLLKTILITVGIILMIIAFAMDTSVEVNYQGQYINGLPKRVNNLGLMADKQNFIIAASVCIIAGLLINNRRKRNPFEN